jgi:putative ubiquitin-RnfH superfamily antitoxin RatB of RatAB toxin-antitoxin module
MPKKRHKPEEIVAKLRQVDVMVSQGQSVADAVRAIGVTEVDSGMSCSMARSSIRLRRRRS